MMDRFVHQPRIQKSKYHTVRITAPNFTATIKMGKTFSAKQNMSAPLLSYMDGWTEGHVMVFCAWKKWRYEVA